MSSVFFSLLAPRGQAWCCQHAAREVVVTICCTIGCKPMTKTTRTAGYFPKITRVGEPCGYLGNRTAQRWFTEDKLHSETLWEHLATLRYPTSAIWSCSKFGTMQPCREMHCPVFALCMFLIGTTAWLENVFPLLAEWTEAPVGTSELMPEARGGKCRKEAEGQSLLVPFHFSMWPLFTC